MIANFIFDFITVKFGELDLPISTIVILLSITVFIFVAVGLSSFKLIQSAFEEDEK
ncbi:hypothetical protein EV05_1866 [Prochlorococcus sp. MIT 0601]|nr:hypothetical protein EV05_1866 [Prochlorococcus sp. MIT 0601]